MTATLEQAQQETREEIRRLQKVIHSFGEGKMRESELKASYIDEIDCPGCGDEYAIFAKWLTNEVVLRDKECQCPIDPHVEQEAIALHHNPPEPDWAPAFNDMCAMADEYDNFND